MANKHESHLTDEEIEALNAEIEEQEPDTGEVITETVLKKAAALSSQGVSKQAMGKQLKLSPNRIKRIHQDERFKQMVQEIGDDAVSAAKAKTRSDISRMQNKAMKALEDNLDKKSLEAVKVWLKAVGMDQEKETATDNNSFTLVLANQKPEPKTVVVKREGEE